MATTHTGTPAGGAHDEGGQGTGTGVIGRVRERATAQLSTQKDKAIDGIGSVTQAVRQSTNQLREQQHDTLAGYVERAADQIDRFSQQLRNKDVGELFQDAQRLARRQPTVFIGSAFVLGLVGARFLKSSSREDWDHEEAGYSRGEYASRPSFNQSSASGGAVSGSAGSYPSQYTGGGAGYTPGTSPPSTGSTVSTGQTSGARTSSQTPGTAGTTSSMASSAAGAGSHGSSPASSGTRASSDTAASSTSSGRGRKTSETERS